MKAVYRAAAMLLALMIAGSASAGDAMGVEVGQRAPEFQLSDLSGTPVSLTQLRERGHVMVLFWSTQCHFCHAMIPMFKEIHANYRDRGLTFVAVNVGYENQPDVEAYVLEHELDYLVLNEDDKKGDIAEAYELIGTPTIQLIAPDGMVVYRGHFLPKDIDALIGHKQG